jgi:hypothetical protein
VYDPVDLVGRYTRLGRSGCEVENLTGELAALAHGSLTLGIEDINLVPVDNGAAVLGIAILPPHGMRDGLGKRSVGRERVGSAERPGVVEVGERIVCRSA